LGRHAWLAQLARLEAREARQDPDRPRDSRGAMPLRSEVARRQQQVDRFEAPLEKARVAPELRRNPGAKTAADALRLVAAARAILPQHVRRAEEPVLVQGVEGDRCRAHAE